jgi:hypothetical protein
MDLAGAVYFISVPGVTEPAPAAPGSPQRATGFAAQQQQTAVGGSNESLQQQQLANDAGYAGQQRLHDQGHPQPERQSSPQLQAGVGGGAASSSPRTSLGDGGRGGPSGGYSSPVQASSTPSWVLPKKTAEPRLGSSPTNSAMAYGGAGPSGAYYAGNGNGQV